MRPIEYRADVEFAQALRCVEYRVPNRHSFKTQGFLAALALRYGLIGSAAAHHLLSSADSSDEPYVIESILAWPKMVEEHLRIELGHRLPADGWSPSRLARWSKRPIETTVPLYRRLYPLDTCLEAAVDDFMVEHTLEITEGWGWWRKRKVLREFSEEARRSVKFALNFFERRELDLEEVPEIALLDE